MSAMWPRRNQAEASAAISVQMVRVENAGVSPVINGTIFPSEDMLNLGPMISIYKARLFASLPTMNVPHHQHLLDQYLPLRGQAGERLDS